MAGNLWAWFRTEMQRRKRTPIYVLNKQVGASPFRIAPERAENLQQLRHPAQQGARWAICRKVKNTPKKRGPYRKAA